VDMDFGYTTTSSSANYIPCEVATAFGAAGSLKDAATSFLDTDGSLQVNKFLSKVIKGESFVGC